MSPPASPPHEVISDSPTTTPGAGPRRWGRVWGAAAIVFGLATLKEGGSVLLSEAARQEAGQVVPFVLWFNVTASFVYVATGAGVWAGRRWARWAAAGLAGATLLVFAALGVHAALGRPFEPRTVAAMTLRSVFWLGAAIFTMRRGSAELASR